MEDWKYPNWVDAGEGAWHLYQDTQRVGEAYQQAGGTIQWHCKLSDCTNTSALTIEQAKAECLASFWKEQWSKIAGKSDSFPTINQISPAKAELEKIASDRMTGTSEKQNVETLVEVTNAALKVSFSRYISNGIYLPGNTSLEIYGEDAARDFMETKWPKLFEYLLASARAKQAYAHASIPRGGKRAQAIMAGFVRNALPGCEISHSGCSVNISWEALIANAGS